MKFRYKIFLISFILTIVSINVIAYLIIFNNFKTEIDSEIDRNLTYVDNIKDTIYSINMLNRTGNFIASTTTIFDTLTRYIKEEKLEYIELYNGDDLIYSNLLDNKNEIRDYMFANTEESLSYIDIKDEKEYLYITSFFDIASGGNYGTIINQYKVFTCKDISEVYIIRNEQIDFFKKVSIISTLIISAVLYITVYVITRRLRKINKALEKVASKDYDIKLNKLGNDEIGELAENVNQMAKAINNNINQIETISKNRQDFIDNLTHEIRTPLTSIIGFSSLITSESNIDKDVIKEYAQRIHKEGFYLKNISDKLTNLILLESGKYELKNINISNELKEVCKDFEERLQKYNIDLKTVIEEDIEIKGDKDLFKALCINLVNNAIKACSLCNDRKREIFIILTEQKELHIIDNGIGISKDNIEKIKEPFYTLEKSRNKEISGIGLGLTLCIKIALLHNAKLDIISKENEGTDIIVAFKGEQYD